jgi:hypothetical protein
VPIRKTKTIDTTVPRASASAFVFAPMYYDSPDDEVVLTVHMLHAVGLTASVTGSPYFKVSRLEVGPAAPPGTPVTPSDLPIRLVPRASSDGVKPLAVQVGEIVNLWITAEVPKDATLPPGKFTGTAKLTGGAYSQSVALEGTYLGTLIGKVTVQPEAVVPGQPVLVQVCDSSGAPVSDPSVTVLMQGVPASARYYQFPTPATAPSSLRRLEGH